MVDGHECVEKQNGIDQLISVGAECASSPSTNDAGDKIEAIQHDLQEEDTRSNDYDADSIGHGEGGRNSNLEDAEDKATVDEDINSTFSRGIN